MTRIVQEECIFIEMSEEITSVRFAWCSMYLELRVQHEDQIRFIV